MLLVSFSICCCLCSGIFSQYVLLRNSCIQPHPSKSVCRRSYWTFFQWMLSIQTVVNQYLRNHNDMLFYINIQVNMQWCFAMLKLNEVNMFSLFLLFSDSLNDMLLFKSIPFCVRERARLLISLIIFFVSSIIVLLCSCKSTCQFCAGWDNKHRYK